MNKIKAQFAPIFDEKDNILTKPLPSAITILRKIIEELEEGRWINFKAQN